MQHATRRRRCPTDHDERADEILIEQIEHNRRCTSRPESLDELSNVFVEAGSILVRDKIEQFHRGPYLELFGKHFQQRPVDGFGDRIQFLVMTN